MKVSPIVLLILAVVLLPQSFVLADAWWGNGYRSPEWVLSNGGSIIRVNIRGGDSDEFKAFMTRGGKYVEVEFGDNMVFDDAKDGTYVVTVYDCNRDCAYQERDDKTKLRGNDTKKASLSVVARPGQTTYLTYDTNGKSLFATSSSGGPIAPPKPKLTQAQIIAQAARAKKGQVCDVGALHPALNQGFIFPPKEGVNQKITSQSR